MIALGRGPAAYTDEGAGPVVIAIHGLPGSGRDFRWLSPELSGFARVVRVDLPGFGQTPVATAPDASPRGRARFVLALAEALGVARPVLLGHSMGGVVACAAVDLAPHDIAGLALLSTPGLRAHAILRRFPVRLVRALLARPALYRPLRPVIARLFAQGGFRGQSDAALRRTLECVVDTSLPEHAAAVRRLALPTLVAWCDDDPLIEAAILAELAAACPSGPRLQFSTGGHNLQKTHARAIAQCMAAWLEGLGR